MVLRLRDAFVNLCHKTSFGVKVEASSALTPDLSRSRPADALVNSWMGGNPAAFDITVTSLTPVPLHEASVMAGTAARLAEQRKHQDNEPKCHTLGGNCIPLAVESYGNWVLKPGTFGLMPVLWFRLLQSKNLGSPPWEAKCSPGAVQCKSSPM